MSEPLWGGETSKAVDNFPISGETVPASVIHWLGRIKGAAARVNADLGKLDPKLADAIARAGDEVVVEVQANAFLHHMVRNIVGSLLMVGRGERDPGWIAGVLALLLVRLRKRRAAANLKAALAAAKQMPRS